MVQVLAPTAAGYSPAGLDVDLGAAAPAASSRADAAFATRTWERGGLGMGATGVTDVDFAVVVVGMATDACAVRVAPAEVSARTAPAKSLIDCGVSDTCPPETADRTARSLIRVPQPASTRAKANPAPVARSARFPTMQWLYVHR